MLGEQHAPRDLPHLVTRAAHSLERARDRGRRLDLDDQVDRAHVDAELEAAGRHHAGEPATLQVVLDDRPLLLGHRAVVRAGHEGSGSVALTGLRHHLGGCALRGGGRVIGARAGALGGQLVEPGGQPLGQPAGVGEDDGRGVPLDQVEDPLLDVRPQRTGAGTVLALLAELGHVLDRHHDLEVPLLLARWGDDLDGRGTAEEPGHLVDRPDRGRQADPLGRPLEQVVEPLQGDREVGTALGAGHRVHLVDDHGLDASQDLAGLRGEHQEQRLRGGDQDVGRCCLDPAAVGGRRVPRAHPDPDLGDLGAEPLGGLPDPDERRPQVALDIDREGLERGDVEHPAALLLLRDRLGGQPVDRPQERRERLAGAGGRHDESVPARRDRLPGALLGSRRRGERGAEPRLGRGTELVHPAILPDGSDSQSASAMRNNPPSVPTYAAPPGPSVTGA